MADPFAGVGGVPHDATKVGKGIYVLWLDTESGALELVSLCELGHANGLPNPAYLAVHPSRCFVYVCHETNQGIGSAGGATSIGGSDDAGNKSGSSCSSIDGSGDSIHSADLGAVACTEDAKITIAAPASISDGSNTIAKCSRVAKTSVGGGVSALAIEEAVDGQSLHLRLLNATSSHGDNPCFCTIDRTGGCLLVANYGIGDLGATIAMLPLRQGDGKVNTAKAVVYPHDDGVVPDNVRAEGPLDSAGRQEAAHCHSVTFDEAQDTALVCDLGSDQLRPYAFNGSKFALSPVRSEIVDLAASHESSVDDGNDQSSSASSLSSHGTRPVGLERYGPRHCVLHPNGRLLFVVCEMASKLLIYEYAPRFTASSSSLASATSSLTISRTYDCASTAKATNCKPKSSYWSKIVGATSGGKSANPKGEGKSGDRQVLPAASFVGDESLMAEEAQENSCHGGSRSGSCRADGERCGRVGLLLEEYDLLPEDWAADQRGPEGKGPFSRAAFGYDRGFNEGRWAADVALVPSGRFIFVSNRLHDTITTFAVVPPEDRRLHERERQDQRILRCLGHTPSGGKTPRSFAVSPDGRHLIVSHQHSHNVVVFSIDQSSGHLTPCFTPETADRVEVPCASCVKFL